MKSILIIGDGIIGMLSAIVLSNIYQNIYLVKSSKKKHYSCTYYIWTLSRYACKNKAVFGNHRRLTNTDTAIKRCWNNLFLAKSPSIVVSTTILPADLAYPGSFSRRYVWKFLMIGVIKEHHKGYHLPPWSWEMVHSGLQEGPLKGAVGGPNHIQFNIVTTTIREAEVSKRIFK